MTLAVSEIHMKYEGYCSRDSTIQETSVSSQSIQFKVQMTPPYIFDMQTFRPF